MCCCMLICSMNYLDKLLYSTSFFAVSILLTSAFVIVNVVTAQTTTKPSTETV